MRSARRAVLAALVLWASLLAGCLASEVLSREPRILQSGPDHAVITWETPTEQAHSLVIWGAGQERIFDDPDPDRQHRFEVSGLAPATPYGYEIRSGSEVLYAGSFRTAPVPGAPTSFRFAVFGDSGKASRQQAELGERLVALAPDLVLHTGDVLYEDDVDHVFLQPYAELLARVPFWPAVGNHDLEHWTRFTSLFELPGGGPAGIPPGRTYAFDYGDARFAVLDSNQGPRTLRLRIGRWLEREMRRPPIPRWRFVVLHHPPYTWGDHEPTRPIHTLVPLFESLGVQMVFSGHDHNYQRTAPLVGGRRAQAHERGVVYVVTGAGGGDLDVLDPKESWPPELVAGNDSSFSATLVEVSANALAVRQVASDGRTLDRFQVTLPQADAADGTPDDTEDPGPTAADGGARDDAGRAEEAR